MINRYGFLEEKALPWMVNEKQLEKHRKMKQKNKLDKKEMKIKKKEAKAKGEKPQTAMNRIKDDAK